MRGLPVRSLFWRAFLTFWGAMAVITVCGMMLTAAVAWYRVDSLDGLNPGNLTRDAAQIARGEGADGLRRWVEAMDARYSALKIYIVDTHDRDILGRRLPTRLDDWLAAFRAAPDPGLIAASIEVPADPAALRVSWWDPQLLTLPDNRELLMLFLPFDSSHWEVLGLTPVALGLLLFALAITAPFCWALTRHVAAPLDQMRGAARALAAGRQHDLLVVAVQVEQDFAGLGVMDDGADGHAQRDVGGGGAVLVRAAAVFAVLGAVQARVTEVDQRVDVAIGHGKDAAAASAVAAVRAALGNEFFAAKARHAIAAFAGDDFDGGFVYEFHDVCACMR